MGAINHWYLVKNIIKFELLIVFLLFLNFNIQILISMASNILWANKVAFFYFHNFLKNYWYFFKNWFAGSAAVRLQFAAMLLRLSFFSPCPISPTRLSTPLFDYRLAFSRSLQCLCESHRANEWAPNDALRAYEYSGFHCWSPIILRQAFPPINHFYL